MMGARTDFSIIPIRKINEDSKSSQNQNHRDFEGLGSGNTAWTANAKATGDHKIH